MERGASIEGTDAAVALFAPALSGLDHEEFWAAYLDSGRNLIRYGLIARGQDGGVEPRLRCLFREALEVDAAALVVAHNHPSGDPAPSRSDIAVTRQIVSIARPLGLHLLDHLIFAGATATSFRVLTLL